jgi:hypothetical protein
MKCGCMDSSYMKEFNNLGMKRVSSLGHAPTSSIKDEASFTKFDEDNQSCNNGSHNRGDRSYGHNSTTMNNLLCSWKNCSWLQHKCSLRHCSWRGTECDVVDVEGVFIVRG